MSAIVHRIPPSKQKPWQDALKNLITKPEVLFQRLNLDLSYLTAAKNAATLFPLKVSEHYLQQIRPGDFNDPLLKQILPIDLEFETAEGFTSDPLNEQQFNPMTGILHKYQSRILITVTKACAIHCRYCFRREFNYGANMPAKKSWESVIAYIKQHPEINEVIYSGGDPLSASDRHLQQLTQMLAKLAQIKRIRIHSRMPLLIPERITDDCVNWLSEHDTIQPIVVTHCNHPNELSSEVKQALERLREAKVTLLNQAVLLKGVNDDINTLIDLSEKLFSFGVLPYYIHLLDRVRGTRHFEVNENDALRIFAGLRAHLPGFLVPKLVRENAGETSKTPVF